MILFSMVGLLYAHCPPSQTQQQEQPPVGVDGFAALAPSVQQLFVNDLKLDNRREHAPVLATEFVGTSITSGAGKYGAFARQLPENPQIRFFESRLRGYTRCTIRPDRWHADLQVVDSITHRDAGVRTLACFVVEDGHPSAHRLH